MVKVIGLTGSIAVGKSTVTQYLLTHGYQVLDADIISHQALKQGTSAYQKVVSLFGCVKEDGTIDRKQLGNIVFSSPEKKKQLEDIIHPYVIDETLKGIKESKSNYVILDVPLLFEAKMDKLCDLTIFVNTKEDVRLARLEKRATMPLKDAKKLNSQVMSAKEKIYLADITIENSSDLEFSIGVDSSKSFNQSKSSFSFSASLCELLSKL